MAFLFPLCCADAATNADPRLMSLYGRVPLRFEANQGQTDPSVKFLSRVSNATVFLTADEAVVRSANTVLRMRLQTANRAAAVEGEQELPGPTRYYRPGVTTAAVPTYQRVKYSSVYPGVDLVYYGNRQELEYDFVVHPGADPRRIALAFPGTQHVSVDEDGALVLGTRRGAWRHRRPLVYQESRGGRHTVPGQYELRADHTVAFRLGAYDRSRPLVIDPVLAYSTYLSGSNSDQVWDLTVDGQGSVYLTGSTTSPDFPVQNPVQGFAGSRNIFVTKLTPDGSNIVYSTFLGQGQGGGDVGSGIQVDGAGNAFITGYISDPNLLGDAHRAIVAKLNADGSLAFFHRVTNTTSDADERPSELALDAQDNIYMAGQAGNTIPIVNGFQTQGDYFGRGFVVILDPTGQNILYSTYIGTGITKANGLALDPNGYVYVTGNTSGITTTPNAFQTTYKGAGIAGDDAFVVKIDPGQSGAASLVYATYLGGSDWDAGNAITVDASGIAVVTGETKSNYAVNNAGFPVTPGAYQSDLAIHNYADTHCYGTFEVAFCSDAFLSVLSPDGSQLWYSTYLGGSGPDSGRAVTLDTSGRVQLAGQACGFFPVTPDATQSGAGSCGTAFLATLDLGQQGPGQLAFSTFLGGTGGDSAQGIGCDPQGNIYIGGWTQSNNFPLVNPFMNIGGGNAPSAFVAKFSFRATASSTATNNSVKKAAKSALRAHSASAIQGRFL
jgi:hypothetical protein